MPILRAMKFNFTEASEKELNIPPTDLRLEQLH